MSPASATCVAHSVLFSARDSPAIRSASGIRFWVEHTALNPTHSHPKSKEDHEPHARKLCPSPCHSQTAVQSATSLPSCSADRAALRGSRKSNDARKRFACSSQTCGSPSCVKMGIVSPFLEDRNSRSLQSTSHSPCNNVPSGSKILPAHWTTHSPLGCSEATVEPEANFTCNGSPSSSSPCGGL